MKTTSKIFAAFFLMVGLAASWYGFYGATHQWYVAGICGFMAVILLADAFKKTESNKHV